MEERRQEQAIGFEKMVPGILKPVPNRTQKPFLLITTFLVFFGLIQFAATTLYGQAVPSPHVVTAQLRPENSTLCTTAANETEYQPNDTLIIYAYHETDNAFTNAEFFIKHAVHDYADFIFMVNGEAPRLLPMLHQYRLKSNIKVIRRENTCMDFGAYEVGILKSTQATGGKKHFRERYKKFILMNSSIRGPFMPTWSDACWTDRFTNGLNDRVKLQGLTYNCDRQYGNPTHMQSMLIATDNIGLNILLSKSIISCYIDMPSAIGAEMKISNEIKAAGYDINIMMTSWHGDKAYQSSDPEECIHEDPLFHTGSYFGHNIHPYETIFAKANRGIEGPVLDKLTEWHDYMDYSSQEVCRPRK